MAHKGREVIRMRCKSARIYGRGERENTYPIRHDPTFEFHGVLQFSQSHIILT